MIESNKKGVLLSYIKEPCIRKTYISNQTKARSCEGSCEEDIVHRYGAKRCNSCFSVL